MDVDGLEETKSRGGDKCGVVKDGEKWKRRGKDEHKIRGILGNRQ